MKKPKSRPNWRAACREIAEIFRYAASADSIIHPGGGTPVRWLTEKEFSVVYRLARTGIVKGKVNRGK